MKYVFTALIAVVAVMFVAAPALADPPQWQDPKFIQLPLDDDKYPGHDEYSTALGDHESGFYEGWFMADDFADRVDTPVLHVKWWGSYMDAPANPNPVQKFLIAFEGDVPETAGTAGYSHPDPSADINLYQTVTRVTTGGVPGPGQFTETLVSAGGPTNDYEALYMYNAELACQFQQEPFKVYWLKIAALVDPTRDGDIAWGWHNRDYKEHNPLAPDPVELWPGERDLGPIFDPDSGAELPVWHFQDDAVSGQLQVKLLSPDEPCNIEFIEQWDFLPQNYRAPEDGPSIIGEYSKDLAFELHTVPEPGMVPMLVGAGLIGLAAYARRRRKR